MVALTLISFLPFIVIPKRNSVFSVEISGFTSFIYGSKFEQRASERSAKKFKARGTIDLWYVWTSTLNDLVRVLQTLEDSAFTFLWWTIRPALKVLQVLMLEVPSIHGWFVLSRERGPAEFSHPTWSRQNCQTQHCSFLHPLLSLLGNYSFSWFFFFISCTFVVISLKVTKTKCMLRCCFDNFFAASNYYS